jgi:hypothetical protein
MAESTTVSGGGYNAFLRRIGLADDGGLRVGRAVPVLAGVCWLPLFGLTALGGTAWGDAVDVRFLQDLSAYGRFLIALPLLLVGEKMLSNVLPSIHKYVLETNLVPGNEEQSAETLHTRLDRQNSGLLEVLVLMLAFALPWIGLRGMAESQTAAAATSWLLGTSAAGLSPAGWWHMVVAMPLLGFLTLRWVVRYLSWALFLRAFSKLDLQLQGTHPDRTAGLGPLVVTQALFAPLFVAGSVIVAAFMGNDILYSSVTLRMLAPEIAAYLTIALVLLLSPLLVFISPLRRAKIGGLLYYGALGDSITDTFAERWKTNDPTTLIDTADPSAVTDYTGMYDTLASMRTFPIGLRQTIGLLVVLAIPFVPLLLTAMSFKQLLTRLVGMIV